MNVEPIYIYADGGCRGNQSKTNIGGWGVLLKYNNLTKEINGNALNTTNNVMELTACIKGLESIKRKDIPVKVVMDSQYVINGMNKWTLGWIKNGWKTSNKEPVLNKELWQELIDLKDQFKNIEFVKCIGHADCEGNVQADTLANMAMDLISYYSSNNAENNNTSR
jgi:ribonuclease HI